MKIKLFFAKGSISSIKEALHEGARMIELDINQIDGKIVVVHSGDKLQYYTKPIKFSSVLKCIRGFLISESDVVPYSLPLFSHIRDESSRW